MSCGCGGDCCKQPDPRGALLSGLMGDLPPIHEGAWFSFGAEIDGFSVSDYLYFENDLRKIRIALENSDYVWPTKVEKAAGVVNPYIVIEGESSREYSSASHLKKAVSDVIQSLGYRFDAGSVNFYAHTYDAATGQPTQTDQTGANNQASTTGCNLNTQGFTNYIACQLGVTPTSAATIGVVGGLVAALLLVKAIK